MRTTLQQGLLAALLSLVWFAPAQAGEQYSDGGTEQCLGCHDFSKDSPVHPMMEGAHGDASNPKTPMAQKGCEHCHGPSAGHTQGPTRTKPGISFGPRWTDHTEQQSGACLQCHQHDKVHDWPTALHQRNDLSCVSCHDLHVVDQAVLNPQTQADVCTVCHKVQKKGVHHLPAKKADNPPCATCHDPHADPSPVVKLLENRSEGCRNCHDFRAMQKSPQVSDRAKQYHRAMANKDKTCIDCHSGVSHSPPNNFPPPLVGGLSAADVALFYPGQSDFDWILSEHDGAQSFRQGRNCLQCHRGDQAQMGQKLATGGQQAGTNTRVAFALQPDALTVTISWDGKADDSSIAIMLDDGSDDEFSRAGCWAACHSDLPGMTRDNGQALSKYLAMSRQQQQSIGRPSELKDKAILDDMIRSGMSVEMWRAKLSGGTLKSVQSYSILAGRTTDPQALVTANAQFSQGRWTVVFSKPLNGSGKAISKGKTYTFGLAIHGSGLEDANHWVSLPMTFSLDNFDTYFIAR